MSKEPKETLYPRCKINYYNVDIPERFPSVSRRDCKTKLCAICGMQESLIDHGIIMADKIENDFVKLLQTKAIKSKRSKRTCK